MVIITDIIGWTSRLTLRKCRNNQQQLLFAVWPHAESHSQLCNDLPYQQLT